MENISKSLDGNILFRFVFVFKDFVVSMVFFISNIFCERSLLLSY